MLAIIGYTLLGAVLLAAGYYMAVRSYVARTDRTFMTHDERGFKRALKGRGVLWDFEESVVKGPSAPRIEFVALDPATGQRRAGQLIDQKTGSVNLRPQYCVPLPFYATTADSHKLLVEARVQFSLNRALLKYVYQLEDFGMALETRIQSAYRAEIGKMQDEVLRASLHDIEAGVIERLRKAEADGDEAGEPGMALGVNFHTTSFTYAEADASDGRMTPVYAAPMTGGATTEGSALATIEGARQIVRSQGVLSLGPQQLDKLADVFKGRDPNATRALLSILEMQTRQNIAESLAASGRLVVITPQELGLVGAGAQRDALAKLGAMDGPMPQPNGQAAPNGAGARV